MTKKIMFLAIMAMALFVFSPTTAKSAELDKAMITITFDDAYASLYSYAYPTLKGYGLTGTAYIPTGYIGTSGYATKSQLWEMCWNGTIEPASHTQNHLHWAALTDAQVLAEVVNAKNDLLKMGLLNSGAFTPPFGDPYDDTYPGLYDRMVGILGQAGFVTSSRVPWDDTDYFNTVSVFNPWAMNSYQLSNPRTLANAKAVINEAIAGKKWLIFTIHDINTGNAAGDLNLTVFKSVASYIATQKNAGKVDVVTISKGVSKMLYRKTLP